MPDLNDFPLLGDELLARRGQVQREVNRQQFDNLQPQSFDVFQYAGDLLAAPWRGAEGLLQGIYGLADVLLLDSLPDYDSRLLGRSTTFIGGMVEGIANFAFGFFPVVGWVGRGAQIGRAGLVVPGLTKLSKASQAAAALRGATGKAKALQLGQFAAAGAITDFSVFDGHEQRLSNLIQSFPALQNPVTEFLQADPNDSEVEGRFKAALEGLGIGLLADAFITALRGNEIARAARARKLSPKKVDEAVQASVDQGKIMGSVNDQFKALDAEGDAFSVPNEIFQKTGDATVNGTPVYIGVIRGQTKRVAFEAAPGKRKARWYEVTQTGERPRNLDQEAELRRQVETAQESGDVVPEIVERLRRIDETAAEESLLRRQVEEAAESGDVVPEIVERLRRIDDPSVGAFEIMPDRIIGKNLTEATEAMIRDVGPTEVGSTGGGLFGALGRAAGDQGATRPPAGIVSPDAAVKIVDTIRRGGDELAASNPRKLSGTERALLELEKTDINLLRMDVDDATAVRSIERTIREDLVPLHETVTNPETMARSQQDLADLLNLDSQPLGIRADADLKTAQDIMFRTMAWKFYLKKMSGELLGVTDNIIKAGDNVTDEMAGQLLLAMDRVATATKTVSGLKSVQGRALQTGNIKFLDLEGLEQVIRDAGGKANVIELANKIRAAGVDGGLAGAKGVIDTVKGAQGSRGLRMLTEYWMNSILSGPKTMAVNFLSGALLTIYRPFEQMMGGVMTGNSRIIADVANQFHTFSETMRESWRAAIDAGVQNRATLTDKQRFFETSRGSRAPAIQIENPQSIGARIINHMGSVIRFPSAVLTGTDELIKQMNYRMIAKSMFMREALENPAIGRAGAAHFVRTKMDKLIINYQAFSQSALERKWLKQAQETGVDEDTGDVLRSLPEQQAYAARKAATEFDESDSVLLRLISEEGVRQGEEVTFQSRLSKNKGAIEAFSAGMQDFVIQHPLLRFVLPFIRTPVNIIKYANERTLDPTIGVAKMLINFGRRRELKHLSDTHNKLIKDLLATGTTPTERRIAEARKAQALGRIATGVGIIGTFSYMASQGLVTGRGPSDPEQRRILEAAGWLPYSIKVGDSYLQYLRLDPWATMIGTVADIMTVGKYSPSDDQGLIEEATSGLLIALTNNVTNKSYMVGLKNFVDTITDPDRKLAKTAGRFVASFVPNLLGQAAAAQDPVMRDVRNITDAILNKTPYYSDTVPPIRNFLGEPVSKVRALGSGTAQVLDMFVPIAYREVLDEFINQEIAILQHSFRPPRAKMGGLDLREFKNTSGQSAFDRMLQLRQKMQIGGVSLRKALRRVIRSRGYQNMTPESTFEFQSPRIGEVNKVINRYHRRAVRELRREFPDLALAIQLQRRNKRAAITGQSLIQQR